MTLSNWILSLAVLCSVLGCSRGLDGVPNAPTICPRDGPQLLREMRLWSDGPLLLDDVLQRARARRFEIEETELRLVVTDCLQWSRDQSAFVIHTGLDETRSYTTLVIVVANSDGVVRAIEVQRAQIPR